MRETYSTLRCLLLGFLLSAWPLLTHALNPALTGVVLLHGKGGDPAGLQPLGEALERAGFSVARPRLPWARDRNYDRSFPASSAEISAAIAALKANGARYIVVGGHSLGGTAALHFATENADLSALVLIAPAHFPEGEKAAQLAPQSVAVAREMIRTGRGADSATFIEVPSGREIIVPAAIYLSYYDPLGPAAMSLFAPQVKTRRIGWFAPHDDPAQSIFAALVVPHLPSGTQLQRIDIDGDHGGAPTAASAAIVKWLENLPAG